MTTVNGRRRAPVFLDPDETELLPDTVWLPVRLPRFGGSVPQLSLRETRHGHQLLPVYSSLALLQRLHGAYDHAMEFSSGSLEKLRRYVGFQVVGLDLVVPIELRTPDLGEDEAEWPTAQPPRPDVAWVPCQPMSDGDQKVQVELHRDDRDELVFTAFTSQETLAAGCGDHQPAVAFRLDDLAEIAAEAGADSIAYDPVLASEARHRPPTSPRQPGRT